MREKIVEEKLGDPYSNNEGGEGGVVWSGKLDLLMGKKIFIGGDEGD